MKRMKLRVCQKSLNHARWRSIRYYPRHAFVATLTPRRWRARVCELVLFGVAAFSTVAFPTTAHAQFPALFELNTLDGTNGFAINGIDPRDENGGAVSGAGDVNGDGIGDFIIGAPSAEIDFRCSAGESYVVLGAAAGLGASFDLSTLDGTNGFVLQGSGFFEFSGASVSNAGDVNGDGIDDIIIGARGADPNGNSSAGETYVVFGNPTGFAASIDRSSLNGTNGFVINGIDAFDRSGGPVSGAGDVNGDGIDDIIIGAPGADPDGNSSAGETYVVFGNPAGFAASIDLSSLNGTNGFVLEGIDNQDASGSSVSGAGDVNGDGIDDIIIGALGANRLTGDAGEIYVVFGTTAGFGASLDLSTLNGANGFVINSVFSSDGSGISVSSAGDFNGDGIGDIIIGVLGANPYVVFGTTAGFRASLNRDTLDGTNGFTINPFTDMRNGRIREVSGAGDLNGDGFDDIILGAPTVIFSAGLRDFGESYVVFGAADGFGASFELSTLNGTNGFVIRGVNANDGSGASVSGAGDVNGDGVDDIIIGAANADFNGSVSGASYVVFGQSSVTDLLVGDFDDDGDVDADDIDFYNGNLGQPASFNPELDLNNDEMITLTDHDQHVTTLVQTSNGETGAVIGDANLDGTVNVLGDALALVTSLGNTGPLGYADGDLNADGNVDVLGDAIRLVGNLGLSNAQ